MNLLHELDKLINLIIIQFKQIFPYWILGVLAGSLLSVYGLSRISNFIGNYKNSRFSIIAASIASILGIASPVCMYGTIPLINSLCKKGVPQYILASFMVSSILLNPNLLIMSFSLGTGIALLRLFACLLAGLAAGILVKIFFKDKNLYKTWDDEDYSASRKKKKTLLSDIHKSITITAPYFLIGIVITAVFERYFPKQYIVALFGSNKGFGVLLAASLGVPVYICGGGTIPLLKLWMEQGMTAGSAIAFMLTGAATKFTNLSAVKTILGIKNFVLYIFFSIIFSVAIGILANFIIQ